MPKGYKAYSQQQQERADGGGGGGGGIYHIRCLEDGESCRLRFLTDHEDLFWGWFHRKTDASGNFAGMKMCPRELGTACEDCIAAKGGEERRKASMNFLAWAYEYEHYYTKPVEGAREVKIGLVTRYVKPVNEIRLWRYASAHMKALEPIITRKGTITDRDYEWLRAGKSGDKKPQYSVEQVGEVEPLPPEVAKLVANLPGLEEVALDRVKSLNVEKVEQHKTINVDVNAQEPAEMPFGGEPEPQFTGSNVDFEEEPF
jgi:hypothetical protein